MSTRRFKRKANETEGKAEALEDSEVAIFLIYLATDTEQLKK